MTFPIISIREIYRKSFCTRLSNTDVKTIRMMSHKKLSNDQRPLLDELLRVDHAGEVGANLIYKGQIWALQAKDKFFGSDSSLTINLVGEMQEQERHHLKVFDQLLHQYRVRPSALRPIWELSGFTLGAITALMGKEAAMACTEAVENVIGEHYNDQIRLLKAVDLKDEFKELRATLREFRDDELEHRETAIKCHAHRAPLYTAMTYAIDRGCHLAIWMASKF